MSNRIDEIMQISNNSHIEEYDDTEVILEHFLNYSMEELNNALPKKKFKYHCHSKLLLLIFIKIPTYFL